MNLFQGRKTYIGIAVVALPTIASLFGYDVTASFEQQFPLLSEEFFVLLGAAIAFYGRAAAQTPGWLVKK